MDDDDVTDDNDEDEGSTPPSTPCLMLKIQSVLDHDYSRKITHKPLNEVRVFNLEVDVPENESESDEQEHELETKEKEQLNDDENKDEIKEDSEENDKDENITDEEVDASDCKSVNTIGYTSIEENDRFNSLENETENEEVITIDDEPIEDKMEN